MRQGREEQRIEDIMREGRERKRKYLWPWKYDSHKFVSYFSEEVPDKPHQCWMGADIELVTNAIGGKTTALQIFPENNPYLVKVITVINTGTELP